MQKEEIIPILDDWNLWKKEPETGFPRSTYLKRLDEFTGTNMIVTMIGVRRSGKSFILRQAAKSIAQKASKENTLLINFEDSRLAEQGAGVLNEIFDAYTQNMKPTSIPYVLLDEVHRIKGWERWARTMHELRKAHIIVTGSTSKIIGRELGTLLTGRHLDITVLPLGFREFLSFKRIDAETLLDVARNRLEINAALEEYMRFGGFPEVALTKMKDELLRAYFEDVMEKDVGQRYAIRKIEDLRKLAKFYLTNNSSPHTNNSAAKFLEISAVTVEKFFGYLEEAFLLFCVKRFSFSFKEREKSARKVYAIDVGLSNAMGFRFSERYGQTAENVVAVELRRRSLEQFGMEIYYWHDPSGKEVDFVIKTRESTYELIQVCWDISSPKTKKREISALLKAMDAFKVKSGLIITEDVDAEEEIKGKKIIYKPLWKWLLEPFGGA